jgi:hypothetical protein
MGRDIDAIVERVKTLIPNVMVEQLRVKFPGVDDDGLWFFGLPGIDRDIQIESPTGNCPFWVEHDGMATSSEARTANTIDAAVEEVVEYLSCLQNPRQT